MRVLPFRFEENTFWLLDQRKLPFQEVWVPCKSAQETAQAIKEMVVRHWGHGGLRDGAGPLFG